jgi:hypothetical protein
MFAHTPMFCFCCPRSLLLRACMASKHCLIVLRLS